MSFINLSLILTACQGSFSQANVQDFVTKGLSIVELGASPSYDTITSISTVPSGSQVTCTIHLINPQALDVKYTLGYTASAFTTAPSPASFDTNSTSLSFTFTLDPAVAEGKTVTFTLDKYCASLNRTYAQESFSVPCESLPDLPSEAVTLMNSGNLSCLAIELPGGYPDTKISSLKISWTREDGGTSGSGTYAVSSLATAPSLNPFITGYNCYYQVPNPDPSYAYVYEIWTINSDGLVSSTYVKASTSGNLFHVRYEPNGATAGFETVSAGVHSGSSVTIASEPASLAKTNYYFSCWNTAADGSGTDYNPGDSVTLPANGDVLLYAKWLTDTNNIGVTTTTSYGTLTFSSSPFSVVQGNPINTITPDSSAVSSVSSGWAWYIDGVQVSGQTGSTLTLSASVTSALSVGSHTGAAVVSYNGVAYSGSFILNVSQATTTTSLHRGGSYVH